MTPQFRKKIAYWFFLLVGMAGIIMQLISYYNKTLVLTWGEGCLSVFCGMLILKPYFLISLWKDIKTIILKLFSKK